MFCNNCGMKLEDGIVFCPNCGSKVTDISQMPETDDMEDRTVILSQENESAPEGQPIEIGENVQKDYSEGNGENVQENQTEENREGEGQMQPEEAEKIEAVEISPTGIVETASAVALTEQVGEKKFCPNCGTANNMNDMFCQNCGFFFGNAGADMGQNAGKQSAKKGKALKIAVPIVIAVAVIALLCVFAPRMLRNAGSKKNVQNYLLYIKDNELIMAKGGKFEPILIGEKCYDDKDDAGIYTFSNREVCYSPDNKYIYYPHAYDTYEGTYDLYRKKLDDKKAEEEKIDTDVVYYEVIDNDKILYIKDWDDRKLYLYQKNESVKVTSDALWAHVSDDGKYIIWETNDEDDRLYVQDIAMKNDKIKLESDIYSVYAYSGDLKTIVYEKDDNLYILKDMEDKEKIASDVEMVFVYGIDSNLQIYYMREGDEVELSAYDLIDDDCLAEDQKMVEPRIADYQTVTYVDDFFGTREKIETDDAYYDALAEYSEKEDRDYIREYLKSEDLSESTTEIYHYDAKSGESNKVFEELVIDGGSLTDDMALLYCWSVDIENLEDMPKLSDFIEMDVYGIEEALEKSLILSTRLWYIKDGECLEIPGVDLEDDYIDNINVMANENNHMLYVMCDYYTEDYEDYYTELYGYDYNAKDASLELLSDEVSYVIDWYADEIYYTNEDGELYRGDTKIDDDVYEYSVEVQGDGTVLYLTDIDKSNQEGTLKVYKNGESVKIADDVAVYTYCMVENDKIAFLADYNFSKNRGDLKVYNGKEVIQVDSDVAGIVKY